MTILIIIAVIILAIIGTPIFAVMAGSAMINFWMNEINLQAVIIEFYQLASKPMLKALFLFAFAGCVIGHSKAPQRLVRLSNAALGWLPGGLAIVAIFSCAMLTSFTGASGITIVALGGLLFPAMLKNHYTRKFSLGTITASGSLGLLFPPSLPVILYGVISKTNIDSLFKAGILPGSLLIVTLASYALWKGQDKHIDREHFSIKEVMSALWKAKYELPLPVLVIGGIYTGFFAVSEAAVIAAAYVLIVEMFIHREIKFSQIGRISRESGILTGGILIILGMALAVTNYMIDAEVPNRLFDLSSQFMTSKYAFLIILNIFLLIVGCMIDIYAATVLIVPLILPIAHRFDIDPIHLGIIFLVNLGIGYVTPPVGLNLFIASIRFKEPVLKLYWAALPFFFLLLLALIAITYIPQLSLIFVR